jgi:hypothetical protein
MFFEKGYQNHTKRTFFSINFTIAKKVSITALYDSYWVLDSIKPWESRVVDIGSLLICWAAQMSVIRGEGPSLSSEFCLDGGELIKKNMKTCKNNRKWNLFV